MFKTSIRFPQGWFQEMRGQLLEDLSCEAFAVLFAKREQVEGSTILNVKAIRYPRLQDYQSQGLAHLRLQPKYIHDVLSELQNRSDVDTIIDVHTHPFCERFVHFSGIDDRDERNFYQWLRETFDDTHYASIVLSQSDYSAREWVWQRGQPRVQLAEIRTQTLGENWANSEVSKKNGNDAFQRLVDPQKGFLARSALAVGLDNLRNIAINQSIAVIGVGGLGSVIAENLIHSGFQQIHLIDPDVVEVTNLNRIVGAYYEDAKKGRLKVDVVRDHLLRINPHAEVVSHPMGIESDKLNPILAEVDWLIVGTDNHLSRFKAQEISMRYFVPLISAGVNITVDQGHIKDMSGEVIIARVGDNLCLHCLKRLSPTRIAADQNSDNYYGKELQKRGYVNDPTVKEPAVKTLNAIVGAMAVDMLLNQYTQRQPHVPIWVYENNAVPRFYEDRESVAQRNLNCFICHL